MEPFRRKVHVWKNPGKFWLVSYPVAPGGPAIFSTPFLAWEEAIEYAFKRAKKLGETQ